MGEQTIIEQTIGQPQQLVNEQTKRLRILKKEQIHTWMSICLCMHIDMIKFQVRSFQDGFHKV